MKKSIKVLLFSTTFLTLTACGPVTKLPDGYKKIDVTNSAECRAFSKKVSNCVKKTSDKAEKSFELSGSLGLKEFSYSSIKAYSTGKESSSGHFKISDVNCDFKFAATNIDKPANEWKVAINLDNISFKFEITVEKTLKKFEFNDVDLAMYITDSNLYFDLSDKDLKNGVHSLVDFIYSTSDSATVMEKDTAQKQIATINAEIDAYLDKYYISGFASGNSSLVSSAEESGSDLFDSLISEIAETCSNNKVLNDLITLADYENSDACALAFGVEGEKNFKSENGEETSVNGNFASALIFNKEGIFESFGVEGNLDLQIKSIKTDYTMTEVVAIKKAKFDINAKYDIKNVKIPSNIKNYKAFPSSSTLLDELSMKVSH